MWELVYKESWAPKNWCFWTVVLKTLESPLDCKEIQPVHPKGNQSWIFIGRTDAEAETPILWPPNEKNWLTGKDPDAGTDGEGNGNPLQCSCLENPRDRGAWWAAVHEVAQSQTQLKRLSSSSCMYICLAEHCGLHTIFFISSWKIKDLMIWMLPPPSWSTAMPICVCFH